MFTPPVSSAPQAAEDRLYRWPLADETPTVPATPQPVENPAVHPVPASAAASAADSGGQRGSATVSGTVPWQRVDAAWQPIATSPTGLDADAQRLVRHLLTQAVGKRLHRRRALEAERLWIWAPRPDLAEHTRQKRFYVPSLPRFHPLELYALLRQEASLALEVLATPPGVLGVEVWQDLLALQCTRIGQVYAALHHWLPALRAQQELRQILEGLV